MTRSTSNSTDKSPKSFWNKYLGTALLVGAGGLGCFYASTFLIGSEPVATVDNGKALPSLSVNNPEPVRTASVDATEASEQAEAAAENAPLTDNAALEFSIALLEKGLLTFEEAEGCTFTLRRQERVAGALLDPQTMDVKLLNKPFSVYMRWTEGDIGRQGIYVDGENENKLLIQLGGIKGRLLGTLKFEPTDSTVMAEARHPVTQLGLVNNAKLIIGNQKKDIAKGGFRAQIIDDQTFEERACYATVIEYDSPKSNATYRKSIVWVDKALGMPIGIRTYTWMKDANPDTIDEDTLLEAYTYTDIDIESGDKLMSADFQKETYRMR